QLRSHPDDVKLDDALAAGFPIIGESRNDTIVAVPERQVGQSEQSHSIVGVLGGHHLNSAQIYAVVGAYRRDIKDPLGLRKGDDTVDVAAKHAACQAIDKEKDSLSDGSYFGVERIARQFDEDGHAAMAAPELAQHPDK